MKLNNNCPHTRGEVPYRSDRIHHRVVLLNYFVHDIYVTGTCISNISQFVKTKCLSVVNYLYNIMNIGIIMNK